MEGDSDEEEDKYDGDKDEVIKVHTTHSRAQRAA